jgi:hypothetical protein
VGDLRPDRELLEALKGGAVVAIRNRVEIPSTYWFGSDFVPSDDLRFRRAEVLRLWPDPTGYVASADIAEPAVPRGYRTNSEASAEKACETWLAGLVQAPGYKDATFAAAQIVVADVGLLSRKAFDRAWSRCAPEAWKKAGPKRRS